MIKLGLGNDEDVTIKGEETVPEEILPLEGEENDDDHMKEAE